MVSVTASVTAQNTFTSSIAPEGNAKSNKVGHLTLSISGTWAGTTTVQRSLDSGVSWLDVEAHTSNVEKAIEDKTSDVLYRVGVKTGNYTSGTAVLVLAK